MTSSTSSSIWREYAKTFVADIIALILAAIEPAIASRRWGTTGFGEFSITYRALALLQPPMLLGLGVALPRYLARLGEEDADLSGPDRTDYLAAALAVEAAILVPVVALLVIGAPFWSGVLFSSKQHSNLIVALAALLVGSCIVNLALGQLRGCFAMRRANVLSAAYLGVIPLVAIVALHSLASVLFAIALLWTALAMMSLRPSLGRGHHLRTIGRELITFGVRRVPGEICLFGLAAIPPIVGAHTHGLAYAGYLAFAMSVVTIAGSAMSPISVVLLPFASRMLSTGDGEGLRVHIGHVLRLTFPLSLIGVGAIEAGLPLLVRLYLGRRFLPAVGVIRIVALAVPGYLLFVALRSSLDAYHRRALSLRGAIGGFAVCVALTAVLHLTGVGSAEAWGYVGGVWCLAGSTLYLVHRTVFSPPDASVRRHFR